MEQQRIIYITNMDSCEAGMLGAIKAWKKEKVDVTNIQVIKAGDTTELSELLKRKISSSAFVFTV